MSRSESRHAAAEPRAANDRGVRTRRLRKRRHAGAFTLVELLVVVAIVAVLAALLMPALARGLEEGRRVQCLGNLRQLAVAAHSYADNHDGFFPMAWLPGRIEGKQWSWDFAQSGSGANARIIPGLLWEGQATIEIHQCPSFRGASMTANDPYTGYNYNTSYVGGEGRRPSARIGAIRAPSRCALFGDGQYRAGANKFMRAPFSLHGGVPSPDAGFWGRVAGTQGFRHRGRTNIAFADGSADSVGDRFTRTEESAGDIAPRTGFLSPDNSLYALE